MSRSRASREQHAGKAAAKKAQRAAKRRREWCSAERCATCAYRPGTLASGDVEDRGLVRVRLALLDAAKPFYCHHGPDGRELDNDVPDAERRLCVGHMDAMAARHRAGYYDAHPPDAPEVVAELREAMAARDSVYIERLIALANGDESP